MALQSKTYTRSTETLFDILDGLKAAYAAAGMSEPQVHMQLDMTSGELCHVFNRGQMETVLLCADMAADTCVLTVSGTGSWYTSMTGALDPVFGL